VTSGTTIAASFRSFDALVLLAPGFPGHDIAPAHSTLAFGAPSSGARSRVSSVPGGT